MAGGEPGGSEDDPEYSGNHSGFLGGGGGGGRLGYKSRACLQLEQAAGAWTSDHWLLQWLSDPERLRDTRTEP